MVAQTQPQTRPPESPEDLAATGFVQSVENCFLAIRGRGVQWSELDRSRALAWHALGLPAGTAIRVLEARVAAWRFRHGEGARLPIHLRWYEPAILEHARHLRQLGDAALDPLFALASPTPTVSDLIAELSGLIAATEHRVVAHVYSKAFDWLDAPLQGSDAGPMPDTGPEPNAGPGPCADADPDAALARDADPPSADLPDLPELPALVEKCRKRMNQLLISALDATAREELAGHLRAAALPAGTVSVKAARARDERLTERWLAGHFGHRVPTAVGWRDPREL